MLSKFKGEPKYLTAINAVKMQLDKTPNTMPIGLRTIGLTMENALTTFMQGDEGMCKATRLTVPIRQNNSAYIKQSLDNIFPLGTTPLTYTLESAINYDFSKSAQKHIILVTDGAESCNGNPCEYIKNLTKTRSDIKIDIIAIGVNSEDFAQLKCLTDSTHGTIFNVENPEEINKAFNKFLTPTMTINLNKQDVIYKNYVFETYD
jgi:Ca-activated chloride channel family protein